MFNFIDNESQDTQFDMLRACKSTLLVSVACKLQIPPYVLYKQWRASSYAPIWIKEGCKQPDSWYSLLEAATSLSIIIQLPIVIKRSKQSWLCWYNLNLSATVWTGFPPNFKKCEGLVEQDSSIHYFEIPSQISIPSDTLLVFSTVELSLPY